MQKLESTDGFVVFDLDDADHALGVVRAAPKILVDGARLLARSITYQFAVFEQRVSGASAGINAKPDGRDEALAAFIAEVTPLVERGSLCLDPAKGIEAGELAPLDAVDTRNPIGRTEQAALTAASVVAAAAATLGGLEQRTVAIEGFDLAGPTAVEVARLITEQGARVVALSTAGGSALSAEAGFDPAVLASTFAEHGADVVQHLGVEPGKPWVALAAEADLLLAGSKAGAITHDNAGYVKAQAVVPIGRVPVTAKALAMLRRAGTVVVPDFVSLAGPGLVAWPAAGAPGSLDDAVAGVDHAVRAVLAEVSSHDDGPLLASCYRAESFLATWQATLPFGRPLA